MTTDPPRVAVIVPVWNDEAHLAQAVESVLAQTYRDWEAIIVDDGSTDRSAEIAETFARRDPGRIVVVNLEHNSGLAEARNRGIAASSHGELVTLLDSDDYLREDYLERAVALYEQGVAAGRRIGIVACNAWIHGPDGLTGQTWAEVGRWRDWIDHDRLLEQNYVFARATFSRAAYDEVGGLAPECAVRSGPRYATSDDYDLWLRIVEAGYEIAVTREPLVFYRYNDTGRSRSPGLIAEAALVAYERALARGALTPRQRRRVRKRMRHWRAVRERALVLDALEERRRLRAGALALRAAPHGLIAFLQSPRRWSEWTGQALAHARRGANHAAGRVTA
jgi:glycosyltransferase involved in cell wall biosynthesis